MFLSQCCGCECEVSSPGEPVDDILTICPDCQEWTGVEFEDDDNDFHDGVDGDDRTNEFWPNLTTGEEEFA